MNTEAQKRSFDVCIKFHNEYEYKDTPLTENNKKLIKDILKICPNEIIEIYEDTEMAFGNNDYEGGTIISFFPKGKIEQHMTLILMYIMSYQNIEDCFFEFVNKLPKDIYDILECPNINHSNYVCGCLQEDLKNYLNKK